MNWQLICCRPIQQSLKELSIDVVMHSRLIDGQFEHITVDQMRDGSDLKTGAETWLGNNNIPTSCGLDLCSSIVQINMISGVSSDVRRPYRYYHQVSLVLCSAIDMKDNSNAGEWTRETVVMSMKVAVLPVKIAKFPMPQKRHVPRSATDLSSPCMLDKCTTRYLLSCGVLIREGRCIVGEYLVMRSAQWKR